jgi:uncharacterized delta-60 repeat protein
MSPHSIAFIDSRVTDYEALIAGLNIGTRWHVLDAQQDGIEQIERLLAGEMDLDAVHIISHGAPGTLYLGSTVLTSSNLSEHAQQLQSIGSRLTATGDILLYGCDMAQGEEGQAFVNALATLTRADVAASTDATGRAAWGANSVLENQTGTVEVSGLNLGELVGTLAVNTAPTFTVGDGRVTTDLGGSDYGQSVTVQADGKILLGGHSSYNFALARYLSDGRLDTSFGTGGKVTTDLGDYDYGRSVTVQADGKILLGGHGSYNFALARYNADGRLDTTFGTDGKVTTYLGGDYASGRSVIVQADGKILLGGSSGSNFALARYNADGSLDTSFGTDGKVTTDLGGSDYGQSVTVQADGKILLGGYAYTNGNNNFALARYNADGSLDTTFDADGKLTTDLGGDDEGQSVTVQADGKILLSGHSSSNFALARYHSDGRLDTTFGTDGKVTTELGGSDYGYSVTVQADGKILLGGSATDTNGSYNFALARYNSDGSLDTTFSPPENTLQQRGAARFTEPEYSWRANAVALSPAAQILDTELVTAGHYAGATLALSRQGGANSQDVFSNVSDGTLTVLNQGNYFAVDGVTIGRVTTNSNGQLVLSFNSNATQNLVNKAMQQIAYSNTSDAPPATVAIDWTFNDGNTGAQGTGGALSVTGTSYVTITPTNDAPFVAAEVPDQRVEVNAPFSYQLPVGTFIDPDLETLSYSVTMADGTGVPPWLTFNRATQTFSGTPSAADVGSLSIRVSASDGSLSASDVFSLVVNEYFEPVVDDSSVATYARSANQYTIRFDPVSKDLLVTDTDPQQYEVRKFTNAKRIEFADLTLNLAVSDLADTIAEPALNRIAELYVAFFNRVPDGDGMEFWLGQYRQGKTINDIADAFYNAGVYFSDLTGYRADMSNDDFIHIVYRNVLGRPEGADQEGLAFWRAELDSGRSAKGTLVSSILDAAHGSTFSDPTNPYHWVQKLLDNKLEVAKQVSVDWGVNYNSSEDSIAKGQAIAAAITPDDTSMAISLVGVVVADIV